MTRVQVGLVAAGLAPIVFTPLAHAQTLIQPGNLGTSTWVLSGSPYIVTGDVTIVSPSTLTIDAGVEVRFPAGDLSGSGLDPTRTEVRVDGQLNVNGNSQLPVTFRAHAGSGPGIWYGIRGTGLVNLHDTVIRDAHVGLATTPSVQLNDVVFGACSTDLDLGAPGAAASANGLTAKSVIGSLSVLDLRHGGGAGFVSGDLSIGGSYAAAIRDPLDFDSLLVGGALWGWGDLEIDGTSAVAAPGNVFQILTQSAAGPPSGVFNYLPEGSTWFADTKLFAITYSGGDGNDVELSVLATSYCTSSTTSSGCTPAMSASGRPSVSAGSGFVLRATSVEGQRSGLIFYGINGPHASPWAPNNTSWLCVKAPTQRTTTQSSGGTAGACDGMIALDFLAYASAHPGAIGTPLAAGQGFHAQAWFRDPPTAKTTNLSNAIHWALAP